mmetsp:Transcript_4096/g.5576  ORF Transcript_4096/g.5576 Transcript_4096/m.5576 type:complete len:96 (+) Transcript_4096:870-1157(+)
MDTYLAVSSPLFLAPYTMRPISAGVLLAELVAFTSIDGLKLYPSTNPQRMHRMSFVLLRHGNNLLDWPLRVEVYRLMVGGDMDSIVYSYLSVAML